MSDRTDPPVDPTEEPRSPLHFTPVGEAALAASRSVGVSGAAGPLPGEHVGSVPSLPLSVTPLPTPAVPADPVFRRRLLRAAIVLLVAAAVIGVVEAWFWSRIAPGVRYQVFTNQTWAPLPTETQHVFVAFAMFVVIGLLTGIVLATAGWTRRTVRGVGMLLLVGLAAALCTLIAGLLGQRWASGIDPSKVAETPGVQTIVEAPAEIRGAPPDREATTVAELQDAQRGFTFNSAYVAAPAAAVITYTVLVAWNGLPNLGRRREENDEHRVTDPVPAG